MKSFLKWAGGKYKIKDRIILGLPKSSRLIEPFVGSASIALNTDYSEYILNDINKDLINLFIVIKEHNIDFIKYAKFKFEDSNTEAQYYVNRNTFNTTEHIWEKSALFIYLNKHCFNGLFRVNQQNKFNVPFGRYKCPVFPETELLNFYNKFKYAHMLCMDYLNTMDLAVPGDVVYCDPPYSPLIQTSNFTAYNQIGFQEDAHVKLALKAIELYNRGVSVVISNHDTEFTRKLYVGAKLEFFDVQRNISRDGSNRKQASELLAKYIVN